MQTEAALELASAIRELSSEIRKSQKMIYMHQNKLAEYRAAGLPVAGIPNFKCQCCKRSVYVFQGRKRVYRGWICAECASK